MFTKMICPFCKKEFTPEIIMDENQHANCNCGAMFCLCLEDDLMDTMEEVGKEFPGSKMQLLRNVDMLTQEPADDSGSFVNALFWKAL